MADKADMDTQLEHEKLPVYGIALDFHATFLEKHIPRKGCSKARGQFEQASLSIVNCIAEGGGRRYPKDRCRFYAMARGSAMESAALLDVLHKRGFLNTRQHLIGKKQVSTIDEQLKELMDSYSSKEIATPARRTTVVGLKLKA